VVSKLSITKHYVLKPDYTSLLKSRICDFSIDMLYLFSFSFLLDKVEYVVYKDVYYRCTFHMAVELIIRMFN